MALIFINRNGHNYDVANLGVKEVYNNIPQKYIADKVNPSKDWGE